MRLSSLPLASLVVAVALTLPLAQATENCSSEVQKGAIPGAATGCSITASNEDSDVPMPEARALMKGLELYCWRESAAWYFSLVSGKNSGADKAEILATKMRGTYELRRKMRALPEGTSIAINPHSIDGLKLSAPPKNILQDLKRLARERHLKLE